MERQEDIEEPRFLRESVKLIIIFHLIGLIGLSLPFSRPYFLGFVPWHQLIMFVVIFLNNQSIRVGFITYTVLIILTGFATEYTGIHRHWPFGDYQYGQTLGWKVWAVPPIIGVNWFLLTYSAGVAMRRSKLMRLTSRIIAGAVLLTLLDVLIEPVAIKLDYWHWTGNHIPINNYISWFVISAIMLGIFEAFGFQKQSRVAAVFLLVQFIFFLILNFSI